MTDAPLAPTRRRLLGAAAASAMVPALGSRPARAQATPRTGGTMVYLEMQAHTNLYPPAGGFYPNSGVLNQITDKLLWQNPTTLDVEPWLAQSWESNPELTQFTFRLRPGVTFSDGSKLDAKVVARNFDVYGLGDKDRRYPVSEVINNYAGSEVLDDLTVRFTFRRPSPGFLQGTSVIGSGIVSMGTLDRGFDDLGDATKIVGTGAFVISAEVPGKSVDFAVRRDYDWAPRSWPHQGRAYLDAIKLIVTPEDSVRIGALTSGQADLIRQVQAYDEPQVEATKGGIYAPSTNGVNNGLFFRPENPLVADLRVRMALLHATDTEEVVTTIFSPNYPRATSIIARGAMGYAEQSGKLGYDPARAKALLDEAGWKPGPGGIRQKDGVPLALSCYESLAQPQSRAVLQLVAQQWAKVGVKLNVLNADSGSAVVGIMDFKRSPIANSMVGRADLDVIKSMFYPSNRNMMLQKGGLGNGQEFQDPTLNGYLEAMTAETDRAKRFAIAGQIQAYVLDQAYMIPLFEEPQVFGAAPYVKGLSFDAVGRPSFYGVWLDKR